MRAEKSAAQMFWALGSAWLATSFLLSPPGAQAEQGLQFRNGTFKVVQLTDLHLGEARDKDQATIRVRWNFHCCSAGCGESCQGCSHSAMRASRTVCLDCML